MKDRRRNQLVHLMAEDLALLVGGTELATPIRRLTPRGEPAVNHAARLLDEYAPGYPAGGMGTTVSGSRDPDKIGTQVADRVDSGKTWPLPRQLDAHLAAAAHHLHQAAAMTTAATVPINAPTAKTRDDPDAWCASCARGRDRQQRPIGQAAAIVNGGPRRTPDGTSGGAQAGSTLCSWCYGFVIGEKTWPPVHLVERRHAGYRIFERDIDRALGRVT